MKINRTSQSSTEKTRGEAGSRAPKSRGWEITRQVQGQSSLVSSQRAHERQQSGEGRLHLLHPTPFSLLQLRALSSTCSVSRPAYESLARGPSNTSLLFGHHLSTSNPMCLKLNPLFFFVNPNFPLSYLRVPHPKSGSLSKVPSTLYSQVQVILAHNCPVHLPHSHRPPFIQHTPHQPLGLQFQSPQITLYIVH